MVPIGTIIAFPGSELTPDWLLCDGGPCSGALATLLNQDTVPDLRGQFLRGLDTSGTVDPNGAGRSLLSAQPDTFASHNHSYASFSWSNGTGPGYSGGTDGFPNNVSFDTGDTGDAETRPKNIAVNFFIYAGDSSQR
jgi:hypothetical protein